MTPEFYQRLGLKPDATLADIRKAFRRLSKTCHPDLFPGNEAAAERFRDLEEAHRILTDVNERAFYDAHGQPRPRGTTAEENARARVLSCVTDLLCQAIDESESLTGSDLIDTMRHANARKYQAITKEIATARERLERAEIALKRIKVKEGEENALRSLLKGQMDAIREFIDKSPEEFELIKQVDAFLKDYEYEMDKQLSAPIGESDSNQVWNALATSILNAQKGGSIFDRFAFGESSVRYKR